jgi:hypothetical protein
VGFGLVSGFIGHLQFLITIQSSPIVNSHNLQCTIACNESLWSAVLHQSSGTSFQWWIFHFLGSQTVLVPQPQQLLTHSAVTNITVLAPLHILMSPPFHYYFFYYLIELQMGFTWWQWYYDKHNTKLHIPHSNKTQHTNLHKQ